MNGNVRTLVASTGTVGGSVGCIVPGGVGSCRRIGGAVIVAVKVTEENYRIELRRLGERLESEVERIRRGR